MKKLILSLTIAACTALTVQAQDDKKAPEGGARPEGREGRGAGAGRFTPEERLKRLTEALTLNQEQQDKIKKIFEEGRTQFEGLRDLPQEERREKMREAMKAQNDKVNEVLTAEQKEKYKELMARRGDGQRRGGGADAEKPKAEGEKK